MAYLENIFQPIMLGNKECRNRIVMGPHSIGYVDDNGLPTDEFVAYVEERAKGGAGAIIIGGSAIFKQWEQKFRIISNLSEDIIPRYEKIAEHVHKHDALVFDQLFHSGGQLEPSEGVRVVAPSAIPHERMNCVPSVLTHDGIKIAIDEFADAAKRSKKGGLDGVEIKCDQGYLIHQFLSPYYNRRDDEYGGTYENRLRFLIELLERIREVVGKKYIVGLRITADSKRKNLQPRDLILSDVVRILKDVVERSQIDYIHVNAATNSTFRGYRECHGDGDISPMNFRLEAKEIKAAINIPVIASSRILSPIDAQYLLENNYCDLVSMTRAHIADAELVNKANLAAQKATSKDQLDELLEDIRPCILCNQGCIGNHHKYGDIRCIYNAAAGREKELGSGTIKPVEKGKEKRILVIGGGPAGLEFSRVAGLRGHRIELWEKNVEESQNPKKWKEEGHGGQALMASRFPQRQGFRDMVNYLRKQAEKNDFEIRWGHEVTSEDLLTAKDDYDAIVLATGAQEKVPPIYNGVDKRMTLKIEELFIKSGKTVDFNSSRVAKNILIVEADWRRNALSIAELLLQKGKNVTICTTNRYVGTDIDMVTWTSYLSRLEGKVKFLPRTSLQSLRDGVATVRNVINNEEIKLESTDQVILVYGAIPRNYLYYKLSEYNFENLYQIGDCVDAHGIPEAILAGNRLARKI